MSGSWVISEEDFWGDAAGELKLRAAWGQSGRAPGAFDAIRTWNSFGLAGEPALVPSNVGNSEIGPEVTSEFEAGFDGDWMNGALSASFTYYNMTTRDALFLVGQAPSNGFMSSRPENIGTINNQGTELTLNFSPIRSANWGT